MSTIPVRRAWLTLVALLVVCGAPMLVNLAGRDSTHTMETILVVSSQETWLRLHEGESRALVVAFNEGAPRVRKPPLAVWLNFLAWSDLDPATEDPQVLVYRARLVTIALGLVTLASVFWIGCSLADLRFGILATLSVGSMVFFQRQARTASYDIHLVAWTTLSVAGALWAMRPLGPAASRGRRLVGWGVSAVALALAVYSKNPLPMLLASIPIGAAIACLSRRKVRDGLWLLGANVFALACVAPWYYYVFSIYPDALKAMEHEVTQPRGDDAQPFYYYIGFFALVIPWVIWLMSGLVHPFVAAVRPRRRARLVPWIWFVVLFLVMSIPAAKQQRYILPIVPAAGLLIAAVWRDHAAMAARGMPIRQVHPLAWLHWIGLALFSIAFGWLVANPAWPGRFIDDWTIPVAALPVWFAVFLTITLLGLSLIGLKWHVTQRPYQAGLACAAWGLIALGVFWHGYGDAPGRINPLQPDATSLRAHVGASPIRMLHASGQLQLEEEFRLYFGRLIDPVKRGALDEYIAESAGTCYVLAYEQPEDTERLTAAGFVMDEPVRVRRDLVMRLWRGG